MDTRDAMEEKRCRGTEGRRGWCFMGRQRTEVRGVEKKPLSCLLCWFMRCESEREGNIFDVKYSKRHLREYLKLNLKNIPCLLQRSQATAQLQPSLIYISK